MRKLMIICAFLLAVSIPIFYFAGTVPYEDVTESYDQVNPVRDGIDGRESWQTYPFGDMHYLVVKPYRFTLNPGESYHITCFADGRPQPYIIVEDQVNLSVLEYTNSSRIDSKNSGSSDMLIEVFIATDFEGTYATAVFLHHYETPNWIFLGCGVILFGLVLAVLAIKLLLRQQSN